MRLIWKRDFRLPAPFCWENKMQLRSREIDTKRKIIIGVKTGRREDLAEKTENSSSKLDIQLMDRPRHTKGQQNDSHQIRNYTQENQSHPEDFVLRLKLKLAVVNLMLSATGAEDYILRTAKILFFLDRRASKKSQPKPEEKWGAQFDGLKYHRQRNYRR